jgi:hypothetical protein
MNPKPEVLNESAIVHTNFPLSIGLLIFCFAGTSERSPASRHYGVEVGLLRVVRQACRFLCSHHVNNCRRAPPPPRLRTLLCFSDWVCWLPPSM